MIPFLKYLSRRFVLLVVSFLIITAVMYGIIMLTPAETRATLFIPRVSGNAPNLGNENFIRSVIEQYGLDDPYPIQYLRWLGQLAKGDWGYSPLWNEEILDALVRRSPATLELTIVTLLFFIPMGLIWGTLAGVRRGRITDRVFRSFALAATSIPLFILGFAMIAIFYVAVRWFPPGRIDIPLQQVVRSDTFVKYTGMLTLDGLLNGRLDVTFNALRHLVLPVLVLGFAHWATLGRITRSGMIDEMSKDYVTSARARGLRNRSVIWHHAFRNTLAPALTTTALSAATLITGVFIVEVVFDLHGVSELITRGFQGVPDAAAAMGFAVYSVILILVVMMILDLLKALVDPRVRDEEAE